MQKLYKIDTQDVKSGKHPIVAQIEAVESAFESLGYDIDLFGMLEAPAGTTASERNLLITPDLSEPLEEMLDNVSWLSVNEDVAETFGKATGSQEMTNVVVRNDLEIGDILKLMTEAEYSDDDETDMLTKLIHAIELVERPKDPEPIQVAGYDLLRKSLGWKAEKLLDATDDFHKALASLDPQGIDIGTNKESPWDCGDSQGFQLKTMQRVTSQGLHKEEKQIPHLSYAWTSDGILVADMEERRGSDKQADAIAEDLGTNMTEVKKSIQSGTTADLGRPARVIAKR